MSDTIELLSTAVGIAALAGINLYLTVLALGIAISLEWIKLDHSYSGLEILRHPAVMIVAGVLYMIEFVADKIKWVDSLWDFFHTAIRPIGGALLAMALFGEMNPAVGVLAFLFCGGIALGTHATKSGARILSNTSPEPFSNILLSLAEDAAVITGLILITHYPFVALALAILAIALVIWLGPKIFRSLLTLARMAYHSIFRWGPSIEEDPLPKTMPMPDREELSRQMPESNRLEWAVPVVTGKNKKLPANRTAYLIKPQDENKVALFLPGKPIRWLDTSDIELHEQSFLLYDRLTLYCNKTRSGLVAHFYKHRKHWFRDICRIVRNESGSVNQKPAASTIASPSPA